MSAPEVISIPEVRVAPLTSGLSMSDYEPHGEPWYFSQDWVRHELRAKPSDLRIVTIDGDAMDPMLQSGDRVLIDLSRRAPSPPGVFAIHDGMGLVAKEIEFIPNTDPPRIAIRSSNPRYQSYERQLEEVNIVGRVVWFSRRL